uniref:CCR4-NOT transcription complex subunit 11 n=1 Tax=Caenorhabditis tropicalis TaxID=1561998 RepID=A0A1I7TVP4_9PELO
MATLFNKIFSGSSSSSNTDLGSMESLCTAINNLCSDKKENVGERAAEIVRQNKDLFEKKPSDIEAFLLNCSPNVGSAAMVAAIKGMFDASSSKNSESGQDRAVELLNHYVDENNFVGEHLKMVPEIIFPLLQNIGTYCLEKKNKPEIGQRIITKALGSMFPRGCPGPKVLTSAHSVLFACALKTKDYTTVEPFIDVQIDEIANEKCVQEERDEPSSLLRLGRLKKSPLVTPASSYLNPKFVLDYLFNGACVLIELKRFEDALFLLETLSAIPTFTSYDQHTDAYKKFVLISLLLNGRVIENTDKLSGTRNIKMKSADYKALTEIKFSRSANTHSKVEELVQNAKDKLRRDGNLELAKLLVIEMKKRLSFH